MRQPPPGPGEPRDRTTPPDAGMPDGAGPPADAPDTSDGSRTGPAGGRAALVATLTTRPDRDGAGLRQMSGAVTHLEVRADLVGDLDPGALRAHFAGKLIYTLRSTWQGGGCDDPPDRRRQRLAAAGRHYDVVDLEADHDLSTDLLTCVPPQRRRISWHGGPLPLSLLRAQFNWMAQIPAQLYLLAPAVTGTEDALPTLQLLTQLNRPDVTAFGTGPAGTWSRLLAPWLGAPVVYGRLTPTPGSGIPTVDQLLADYPFPALPPLRRVYGIVGRGVETSLSPRLHNVAYRECGLPSLFLPFYVPTRADFLTSFWPAVPGGLDELGTPLRGLTVTAPLKEVALAMADATSPTARSAGSANALVRRNGRWRAETTDASGIAAVLRQSGVTLDRRRVVVIGCGGAGRGAAVGLVARGAEVTMVNRSHRRGQLAADLLGLPFVPLTSFTPADASVVVHATPVSTEVPFAVDQLPADAVVLDLVYRREPTALVAAARGRGLRTLDGWDVLAAEVAHQFRLMTGQSMPELDRPGTTTREAGRSDVVPSHR